MNHDNKMKRVLTCLFSALTGLAALFAVLAVLWDFEVQSNYFRLGAVLPQVAVGLTLAAIAVGLLRSLIWKKEQIGQYPFRTAKFLSPAFYGFLIGAMLLLLKEISATTVFMALCLALSAAYIFFTESPHAKTDAGTAVFYGFAAILTSICFCALFYFDSTVEINAPMKTASTLALLCSMIYFTGELRFLLERPIKKFFLIMAHTVAAISFPVSLAVFTSFWMRVAYTVANTSELSFSTLLQTQRIEELSAAVVVLCTGLHAHSKLNRLLSQPAESAEEEPSETTSAEQSAKAENAPPAQEPAEKQPLPWEIDVDTRNRKE